MTLKKDFLPLSALEKTNLVKSLTDFFEKLYPPLIFICQIESKEPESIRHKMVGFQLLFEFDKVQYLGHYHLIHIFEAIAGYADGSIYMWTVTRQIKLLNLSKSFQVRYLSGLQII